MFRTGLCNLLVSIGVEEELDNAMARCMIVAVSAIRTARSFPKPPRMYPGADAALVQEWNAC